MFFFTHMVDTAGCPPKSALPFSLKPWLDCMSLPSLQTGVAPCPWQVRLSSVPWKMYRVSHAAPGRTRPQSRSRHRAGDLHFLPIPRGRIWAWPPPSPHHTGADSTLKVTEHWLGRNRNLRSRRTPSSKTALLAWMSPQTTWEGNKTFFSLSRKNYCWVSLW